MGQKDTSLTRISRESFKSATPSSLSNGLGQHKLEEIDPLNVVTLLETNCLSLVFGWSLSSLFKTRRQIKNHKTSAARS